MKNIFSQFGTKKVAGVVLAGATLLVGLGVVNNFSNSSQKAANEAALSRFGDSAYNNFVSGSSASRADLERQMAATQDGYSARFLRGESEGTEPEEAFSSDGAYAEGVRGGDGTSYGSRGAYGVDGAYVNGDAYQPIGSTYEQGIDGMPEGQYSGAPGYVENDFGSTQAIADAASKGAKGGKNGKGGNTQAVRPATQVNKLSASSGGSSFGSGAGGGARGGGASASFATGSSRGDNNTRALPQTNAGANIGGSQAFKFGRSEGMGASNVGFNGSESKGGSSRGSGAAADLELAVAYSGKAAASRQSAGAKSLAEAAFDGSNPEDLTPTIPEGASIDQFASALFDGNRFGASPDIKRDMDDLKATIDLTSQQQSELVKLQDKIKNRLYIMVGVTLALALLLFAFTKAFYNGVIWAGWAALAVSVVALGFIAFMMWTGGGIVDLIKEMSDNSKYGLVNQGIDVAGKLSDAYWIAGELGVLLGLCWVPWGNAETKIGKWLSTDVGKFFADLAKGTFMAGLGSKVKNIRKF